jgi:hypothetical protein
MKTFLLSLEKHAVGNKLVSLSLNIGECGEVCGPKKLIVFIH